jgi:hypothetical protein
MRAMAALTVAICLMAAPVHTQETRAEVLERQRAEKATKLEPYKPGTLEKLALNAENGKLKRIIAPHNGFFVAYDYTYKPVGSGIGFSGGFRHDLFHRNARVEFEYGESLRHYRMARADFSLPRLASDRLEVGIEGIYRRQPQDDFYGLGQSSLEADRVSFFFKGQEVQGRAIVSVKPWLHVGTRFGQLSPSIGSGTDSRFPSIEDRFAPGDVPGLLVQPDFRYGGVFAEADYRDEPGNARQGGHYVFTWRQYADSQLNRFDFRSSDLLLQQFIPIFDKKRVFAFQFGLVGTAAAEGQDVPFYMQPTLGGSRQLRSVNDYRFRDRNAMWLNAEYRWEAFSALDMALFTDWGSVAPELGDLGFSKHAYGIGFRFNTPKVVFMRIDIATGGGEGLQMFFKWSKVF